MFKVKFSPALALLASHISCLLANMISGTISMYSAFGPQLCAMFKYSDENSTAITSSATYGLNLIGPLVGFITDRYGPRVSTFIGTLFITLGYFLMSLAIGNKLGINATNYVFMAAFYTLIGIGSAFGYNAGLATLVKNATSSNVGLLSGVGVGFFSLSAFVTTYIKKYFFNEPSQLSPFFLFMSMYIFTLGMSAIPFIKVIPLSTLPNHPQPDKDFHVSESESEAFEGEDFEKVESEVSTVNEKEESDVQTLNEKKGISHLTVNATDKSDRDVTWNKNEETIENEESKVSTVNEEEESNPDSLNEESDVQTLNEKEGTSHPNVNSKDNEDRDVTWNEKSELAQEKVNSDNEDANNEENNPKTSNGNNINSEELNYSPLKEKMGKVEQEVEKVGLKKKTKPLPDPKDIRGMAYIKHPGFWYLLFNMTFVAGAGYMYNMKMGTILTALSNGNTKLQSDQVTLHTSLFCIFNFLGRVLSGFVTDWCLRKFGMGRLAFMALASIFMSVGTAILMFSDNLTVLIAPTILIGLSYGFIFVITPALISDWFTRSQYGFKWGFVLYGPAIGNQMYSSIFSLYYDQKPQPCTGLGCYSEAFTVACGCTTLYTLVTLIICIKLSGKK